MKKNSGLTIVQLMVVLFIVGIVGWFLVDFIIDKRCEADPAGSLCAQARGEK